MSINDELMNDLKYNLGVKTGVDVVDNALTLLDWAVKEVQQNKVILTSTPEGNEVQTLLMPVLEHARRCAESRAVAK